VRIYRIAALALAFAASAVRGTTVETDQAGISRLASTPRSLALGGGISALDVESTAVRSNPAGLAQMKEDFSICLEGALLELDQNLLFFGAAGRITPRWTIGGNSLCFTTGDDIEFRGANTLEPVSTEHASIQQHTIAVAGSIFNALDLGLSAEYVRNEIGPVLGEGFSGHLGFLYRPYRRISLALIMKDLVGGLMHWSRNKLATGTHDEIGRSLTVGGSLDLNPFVVTGEVRGLNGSFQRYSGGIEWEIVPELTARAGLDRARLTAGFGFTIPYSRRGNIRWDYAFVRGAVDESSYEHRLAITTGYSVYGRKHELLFPTEEPVMPGQEPPEGRPAPFFRLPGLKSIFPAREARRGAAKAPDALAVAPLVEMDAPPGLAAHLADVLRTEIAKQNYAVSDLSASSESMPTQTPVAPAESPSVAVLDFEANNTTPGDAVIISDLIRSSLVKSGKYSVIEKGSMDKILAEQAFQKTGCADEGCAVKLGKVMNAKKVMIGSYGILENTRIINARIVNVETSRIEISEIVKVDDVANVDKSVSALVDKLIAGQSPESAKRAQPCDNAKCAAELGKQLGVRWVVAGKIEKMADGLNAYFLAVDPAKGKVKYEDRVKGKTPEELEAAVKIAALRIAVNIRR
jgi:TolB-like protein